MNGKDERMAARSSATLRVSGLVMAGAGMLLVVGVMWLTGCEQAPPAGGDSTTQPAGAGVSLEDVERKTREMAEAGLEYLRQKKEQYEKHVGPELDRLGERVEEMKQKLREVAEDARPELEKRVEELGKEVEQARERFEKLKEASGPAWEEARRGLDRAVERLRSALGEAAPETQPAEPSEQRDVQLSSPGELPAGVHRIAWVAFEYAPVVDDGTPELLATTRELLKKRFAAAEPWLGPVRVTQSQSQPNRIRIEVKPETVREPAGERVIRRLCVERGVVSFRILVEPVSDGGEEWAEMRQRLAERGPRREPGDTVAWFRIPDPVSVLNFESQEQFESYDINSYSRLVLAQRGDAYFVLGKLTEEDSLVHDFDSPWEFLSAVPSQDANQNWGVHVKLDETGAEQLRQLTRRNIRRPLGILIDERLLAVTAIQSVVGSDAMIAGSFTQEQAASLAAVLSSTPLPLQMRLVRGWDAVTE